MARESLSLSCVPVDEECTGAGQNPARERAECNAYRNQLRRMCPDATAYGVSFVIKSNPHDFGSYLEVNATFNDADEKAAEYAYGIDNELPAKWDDEARAELAAFDRTQTNEPGSALPGMTFGDVLRDK